MVDLLVLNSLDQLLFMLKLYFLFHKTTYLIEEVNRAEPFPSARVPWPDQSDTLIVTYVRLFIRLTRGANVIKQYCHILQYFDLTFF